MKKLLITTLFLSSFFGVVPHAYAQVYQAPAQPIQNATNFTIDITVEKPGTTSFVENLSINDPRYRPANEVPFTITVKNTGKDRITNMKVTNNFPAFLVNSTDLKPTASFSVPSLDAGKSQSFSVKGKIADATSLPADQQVFCLVNQAVATANNQTASDNAQFCIENNTVTNQVTNKGGLVTNNTTKGGLPVYQPQNTKATPNTGPEAIALIGLLPTGAMGYFLRKKTK